MNGAFNIVVNAERQRSLAYLETRRVALIIDTHDHNAFLILCDVRVLMLT